MCVLLFVELMNQNHMIPSAIVVLTMIKAAQHCEYCLLLFLLAADQVEYHGIIVRHSRSTWVSKLYKDGLSMTEFRLWSAKHALFVNRLSVLHLRSGYVDIFLSYSHLSVIRYLPGKCVDICPGSGMSSSYKGSTVSLKSLLSGHALQLSCAVRLHYCMPVRSTD